MAHQATGSVVAKKFANAYEESERLNAELKMFERENAMLRDEIDRSSIQSRNTTGTVERMERERMAALEQAGYKQRSYGAHAGDDSSAVFASVPNTQFSTFESRLKTYRQWPHSAAIRPLATPSALASQGFYFAPDDHYKDRVLCAFCNLELAEWGPKDDPIYEHGKILAIQTHDPEHLREIIHEEEANVAKLQVLQMGMQKQLEQYTDRVRSDKVKREQLEEALRKIRLQGLDA